MKSRRRRALALFAMAGVAAIGAAALAAGYGSSVARGYGPLRPVVVAAESLDAGAEIVPRRAASALAVRRVPARFVPPGALADPSQALGLAPAADLPAGGYLLAGQLRSPHRNDRMTSALGSRRSPVEIAVAGAGALLAGGAPRSGVRVDVIVVEEPRGAGPGRTHVAAAGVPLISLSGGTGPASSATATLGLTRGQALRLIGAQSFARRVTLLPAPTRAGGTRK